MRKGLTELVWRIKYAPSQGDKRVVKNGMHLFEKGKADEEGQCTARMDEARELTAKIEAKKVAWHLYVTRDRDLW